MAGTDPPAVDPEARAWLLRGLCDPEAAPPVSPAGAVARTVESVDACQMPSLLRRLDIRVVPCLALDDPAGAAVSVALPGADLDAAAWDALQTARRLPPPPPVRPIDGEGWPSALRDLVGLTRILSHDLRSPILGSARLVDAALEDPGLPAALRHQLERAASAAHRGAQRLEGLVRLLRIPTTNLSLTRIDAEALCHELLAAQIPADAPVRPEVRVQPGLAVYGDLQLVNLALQHLLDNALKFSGGRPAPQIRVSGQDVLGYRLLIVSDNGPGFSARHATRLFEPFERLHLQSEFPGEGLGLALARSVAARHGGWAWADVGCAGWTRFVFALPDPALNPEKAP